MAAITSPVKSANTIEGNEELTINIRDITTVDAIAQQVKQLGKEAVKITRMYIDTTAYFQALDEQEVAGVPRTRPTQDSNKPWATTEELEEAAKRLSRPFKASGDVDPTAASLCRPLFDILHTILLSTPEGGSLKTFSWPVPNHKDRKFTRSNDFWSTLYAHDQLEYLHLDFFCHEVGELPPPPTSSGLSFPELKTLRLDTSSAHGDDGAVIDAILHACPNLESLHLQWTPYDLDSCQMKNISWGWTFPKLHTISVYGWNFAPTAYTDFFVRHPSITSLEERVDGPYEEEGKDHADMQVPATALPKLRTLKKEYSGGHKLEDYFDPAANRPIRHLTVYARSYQGTEQSLLKIAMSPIAQTNLQSIEFLSEVSSWRDEEADPDSSDDEDETAEERHIRKEKEEQERQKRATNRLPHILKAVLPSFTNLTKLAIEMDSSNGTWNSSTKDFIYPSPMNESDLIRIFTLLPKSSDSKLKLLRLKDARAQPLETVERRISEGEIDTGSLPYLVWEGEEKVMVTLPAGKEMARRAEMSDVGWD